MVLIPARPAFLRTPCTRKSLDVENFSRRLPLRRARCRLRSRRFGIAIAAFLRVSATDAHLVPNNVLRAVDFARHGATVRSTCARSRTPRSHCADCLEAKEQARFDREHVVPEAFGKFEHNFVLHDTVCADCNAYFGRTLDLQLGRQSIEGLDRYDTSTKAPDANTKLGGSTTLTGRVNDGGFADGAEVYWASSEDRAQLVLQFFPQFGVTDGSRTTWFRAQHLPPRSNLAEHGFTHEGEIAVKCLGMDGDSAQQELSAKGYAVEKPVQAGGTRLGDEINIRISGKIDRILRRAIAKIACNYLAYHYPGVARMEQTVATRRYARYAMPDELDPVALSPKPLVAGATTEHAPVAHAVAVEWKGGRILGHVTLFFRFRYVVDLGSGFLVAPTMLECGHLFNVASREILPLTTDPSRGRPLAPPRQGADDRK